MNRKKFFSTQIVFPDGEGFNALPIAFVYVHRAPEKPSGRCERNEVQSKRSYQSRFDFAPCGRSAQREDHER